MGKGPVEFMSVFPKWILGDATSSSPMHTKNNWREEAHFVSYLATTRCMARPLTSSTREALRPPPELQATPNYRPCTCHCLEKRRRRFEAPSTRIYPNMPHSRKRCKPPLAAVCIVLAEIQATYIGATCHKPPTCRTPNLCPLSTFINWATR